MKLPDFGVARLVDVPREGGAGAVAACACQKWSMTPDGRTTLHSYSQLLANLYIVSGVVTAR